MRLSESILGKDHSTLEDVNTWGVYHIKNLVAVMGDILEKFSHIDAEIDAESKHRLSWVHYSMEDKIKEVEECLNRYVEYVYDLERKVEALEGGE